MTTEAEAKTKWCPFARIAHVNAPTGGNRHYSGVGAEENLGLITRCIGSECMAWRWDRKQMVGEYDSQYSKAKPENRQGYCGLAGKL